MKRGGHDIPAVDSNRQGFIASARVKVRGILLLVPALVILSFFAIALVNLLRWSFFEHTGDALVAPAVSLESYAKVFGDWLYLGTLLLTIKLAVITMIASMLLALPMAYWIVRTDRPGLRAALILLVAVPFLVSHIVKLFALVLVLGNTGLINWTLRGLEILGPGDFIPLIRNETSVVIGLTGYILPFLVFLLAVAFRRFDRVLEDAAQNLGADEVITFFRVTLPLTMPGIISAAVLAFVLAATAVSTPLIMGGGGVMMVANMIYDQAMFVLNMPLAAALAVVALVSTVIILSLSNHLEQRYHGRRRLTWTAK